MKVANLAEPTSPRRRLAGFAALISAACLALQANGCAVSDVDLARWQTTLGGPKRLSAVVLHDKYPHALRVDAALSLIKMKPRKGRHVGIFRLVKGALVCDPEFVRAEEPCAIATLNPDTRGKILADLVPKIVAELAKKPPPPGQDGRAVPDPSLQYKDAAYMMLTYDKTQVIADQALRNQLETALIAWAMADFERRLADRGQAFGMEQLLRHLGAASVKGLPAQMVRGTRALSKMADLVARIGSKETREEASTRLVAIAKRTSSGDWRKEKLPGLKEANRKAGFSPSEKRLEQQLDAYQDESVIRIFGLMKKIGGSAVRGFCLEVGLDEKLPAKRRQTALAALEGHVDRGNVEQTETLFKIAMSSKTPPEVVDQAFRRIKELPREKAAERLYKFFKSDDWKLRRLAGTTILSMSKVEHIDEFMRKLGSLARKNFNLPEAITYGAYLGSLKGGDAHKALLKHMKRGRSQARLSALSYYYTRGNKENVGELKPFEGDQQSVSKCEDEDKCDWNCRVGEEKEVKAIETVGDFVSYCLKPKAMATPVAKVSDKDPKKKPDKAAAVGKKSGEIRDKKDE